MILINGMTDIRWGLQNFALQIKAECQNVTNLRPSSNDFTIMCKVKCTACNEEHPKIVGITYGEEQDLSGSRGTGNLVMKCNVSEDLRQIQLECATS